MELWNKYLGYHPEITSRLEDIDNISKKRILKKLKNEKDKKNFASTLTELSFYEFFQKGGFQVEYDKPHGKFTPDLTITKNNRQLITEVVRLNTTEKDTLRNDFEYDLMEEIEMIAIGCCLQIDFVEEYFDASLYNKNDITEKVKEWIKENCKEGRELKVFDNFIFRVLHVAQELEHVCVMGNVNSIDIDTRRLNADNSRFIQKIGKYESLTNNLSLPYVLCIKIDFHAAIGEKEMFWTLYGDLVFHYNFHIYHSELNGVYYVNELSKSLSGVFLMISDKFFYFHNFKENRLDENIKAEFLKYQCYCETFSKLNYLQLVPKT